MTEPSSILVAALALAAKGWPVFPCHPETKRPLTPGASVKGAKDGGLYVATCDETQIRNWWSKYPKALIGLPTGAKIGAFVIDLDAGVDKATGEIFEIEDIRASLEETLGHALPRTFTVATPRGGQHLYFQMPPGETLGNRGGLIDRVDVRGDGGYVIAPPSARPDGAHYAVAVDIEIAEATPEILALVRGPKPSAEVPEKRTPSLSQQASAHIENDKADEAVRRYALRAFDEEIRKVETAMRGNRNSQLNESALKLGQLVAAGALTESTVRNALAEADDKNSAGETSASGRDAAARTINSGMQAGMASPRDLSAIRASASQRRGNNSARAASARPPDPLSSPPPSASSPAPLDASQGSGASQLGASGGEQPSQGGGGDRAKENWRWQKNLACARLPQTDLGNAQRFIERYGRNFLFVEKLGWLAWDGRRWNSEDANAIFDRAVHNTIKGISSEAKALRRMSDAFDRDPGMLERLKAFTDDGKMLDDEGDVIEAHFWNPVVEYKKRDNRIITAVDRLSGWCLASQSNAHISCVVKLAKAYLTAAMKDFDIDPMAFNVANGTLRFKKTDDGSPYVIFTRHRREDKLTKLSEVIYDPKIQCPVYDKFLTRVQPDPDMRRHLHAWGGLTLTGMQVACLSLWYGTGRNGKSTCIDAWGEVMGEYGQTIPIESFLDQGRVRKGGEASPDIAGLPGVRGLRTSEPERGAKLAEGLVKMLTGGEPMKARHLNLGFFEFRPVFKLTMQSNHLLRIDGTDEGIWARMLLVPWTVMIPKEERDTSLPEKLKAEASGILNRLLDGLCDFLDNGLSPTAEVMRATAEYRDDSDPIGRFLGDCTVKDENANVEGGPFYKLYVAWQKANGEAKFSTKSFSRALQDHGIKRIKSSLIYYEGIYPTKTVADFAGKEFEDEPQKKT